MLPHHHHCDHDHRRDVPHRIAFLRVPYWNRTVVTHAIPNAWDVAVYVIQGNSREQIPVVGTYENGTKFAEYESLIDRMRRRSNKSSFVPPKQLVALERDTFDMDRTKLHKFDSVPPILRDVALPKYPHDQETPTSFTNQDPPYSSPTTTTEEKTTT